MCKYSYLSGACANRRVDSLHCVGEGECEFSGMNILGTPAKSDAVRDSGAAKWLGLYCHTHGRFLCGDGNSRCESPANEGRARRGPSLQSKLDDGRRTW